MNFLRACVCCGALLLLNACATRPPVTDAVPEAVWLQHQASVLSLNEWQVQGRVAIRSAEDGWNANFDWQQFDDRYRIRLRGPFGQGAVELQGDSAGVWLRRKDRAPVFARDAEALLVHETGWRLPVTGLVAWLRGVPQGDLPATLQWDGEGRLKRLQQSDWQVDYRRYQGVGGRQLPDRLQLRRDSLHVKVVVDHWQTP